MTSQPIIIRPLVTRDYRIARRYFIDQVIMTDIAMEEGISATRVSQILSRFRMRMATRFALTHGVGCHDFERMLVFMKGQIDTHFSEIGARVATVDASKRFKVSQNTA